MFEKFGEFGSAEEINKKAEELMNSGDMKGMEDLAEENGIDKSFVTLYMNAEFPGICDPMIAAMGKIDVEEKALKLEGWGIMADWTDYLRGLVEDETMARAVRKKGKSLAGAIAVLLKWSSKNRKQLPKEICKAAGVPENVYMGTPGMGKAKELIMEYYRS